MNKFTFSTFVILQLSLNLFSQTDNRWFVKNGNPKTTMLVSSTPDVYNYDLSTPIGNFIEISGISIASDLNDCYGVPPTNQPCDYGTPGKDIFIIFENGKHFNSRGTNICDVNWWNIASNSSLIGCSSPIKYLYLTNIYQGDDPPANTLVSNITYAIPPNLTFYSEPANITANHDIVRGKDYTIIIPKLLFDSCKGPHGIINPNINLEISQATDHSGALRSILKLNSVFNGTWSYEPLSPVIIPAYTDYPKFINNVTPPGEDYHYINFNADFIYDQAFINQQIVIKASCAENTNAGPWTISETIRDLHDPNKIEVKCVFKKRKCLFFGPYRYYVKYLVEFFNDGPSAVSAVNVSMTLPECAIPGTIKIDNWSFGGEHGCSDRDQNSFSFNVSDRTATFNLSTNVVSQLTEQTADGVTNPTQLGRFEFCVEVDQDPSNGELNLQPSQPTSSFDGIVFPIYNYIDPIVKAADSSETRRIRPFKKCNCDCKLRQPLTSIGGQQR